jgi:hypothetical protein
MMFTAASDPSRRSSNGRGHMTTAARIFCEPTNLALVNGRRRHRAATVRRRILAVMRKVVLQNEGRPIDDRRSIDRSIINYTLSRHRRRPAPHAHAHAHARTPRETWCFDRIPFPPPPSRQHGAPLPLCAPRDRRHWAEFSVDGHRHAAAATLYVRTT